MGRQSQAAAQEPCKTILKKNGTESKSPTQRSVRKSQQRELTIGVDLGDRTSRYCVRELLIVLCLRLPRKIGT